MTERKTQFEEYLAEEVKRSKSVCFPVKTGTIRRMLIKKASCDDLHPNPDDEFCVPSVGPNYKIISRYQEQFLNAIKQSQPAFEGEPIIVERLHPDGYMIINGHHRWAAAQRIGLDKIPVRVVNLMHEEDVRKILANSTHIRRVALDLDEVVFRTDGNGPLEEALSFPWNIVYKERIRRGIPALFHFLAKKGYDIWLYSSQYYSTDYIQHFFRHYHVRIAGVMTAIGKKEKADGKRLEKMITEKYLYTVHIDNDSVLQISRETKTFREVALKDEAGDWSENVMQAITAFETPDDDSDTQE